MSRGSKRNARRRHAIAKAAELPKTTGESSISKSYDRGNTVSYAYRIRGPQSPVHVRRMTEDEMKVFGVSR